MKRNKTLILGIISGLFCAGAVFLFMQSVQGKAEASRIETLSRYGGEQVDVCVAQRNISAGEKVDYGNVTTKVWVADLLPEGAVHSFAEIMGKEASSNILAGEVISTQRFNQTKKNVDIPKGLCAISVPAKDVQAVGGSLVSGMRVDLYATGVNTELLAQNVLVISTNVDNSADSSGGSISWVTLALEEESIQEIVSASQKLELYFVLPGSAEKEREKS